MAGPPVGLHGAVESLVSAEKIVDVSDLAIPVAESFPAVDRTVPVDGAVSGTPAADAAKVGVAGIIFEVFVKQDFRNIVVEGVVKVAAVFPAGIVIAGAALREGGKIGGVEAVAVRFVAAGRAEAHSLRAGVTGFNFHHAFQELGSGGKIEGFDLNSGVTLEEAFHRRDREVIGALHHLGFVFDGGVLIAVCQRNGCERRADLHRLGGERKIADTAVDVDVVEVGAAGADVLQPDGADVNVVGARHVAFRRAVVLVVHGPAQELLGVFLDEEGPGLPAGRDLLKRGGFVDAAAGSGRAGQAQLPVAGDVSIAESIFGAPDVEVGSAESRIDAHADFVGSISVVRLDVDGDLEAVAALAVEVIVAVVVVDGAGGGEVDDALLPGGVAQIEILVRLESTVEFGEHRRRAVQRGVLPDLLPDGRAPGLTIVIDRGAAVVEELL